MYRIIFIFVAFFAILEAKEKKLDDPLLTLFSAVKDKEIIWLYILPVIDNANLSDPFQVNGGKFPRISPISEKKIAIIEDKKILSFLDKEISEKRLLDKELNLPKNIFEMLFIFSDGTCNRIISFHVNDVFYLRGNYYHDGSGVNAFYYKALSQRLSKELAGQVVSF